MKKIKVQICTGTACFVMGGSELLLIKDSLPEDYKDIVELEGFNCMELCKKNEAGSAPFVKVNGKLISNATLATVIEEILKCGEENA